MSNGYRNISGKKPDWQPVVVPTPAFSGPDETKRYRDAVADTTRQPGEDVCDWLERINRAARPGTLPEQRLPYRDPGSDDD